MFLISDMKQIKKTKDTKQVNTSVKIERDSERLIELIRVIDDHIKNRKQKTKLRFFNDSDQ